MTPCVWHVPYWFMMLAMGGTRVGLRSKSSTRARAVQLALFAVLGSMPSGCGGRSTNEGGVPVAAGSGGLAAGTPVSNAAGEANGGLFGIAGEESGRFAVAGEANGGRSGVAGEASYGGYGVADAGTGAADGGSAGIAGSVGIQECMSPSFNPTDGLVSCDSGEEHRPAPTVCTGAASGILGGPAPCIQDDDCGPGMACFCAYSASPGSSSQSRCLPAHCRTDAECGAGSRCALTYQEFSCLSPLDECHTSEDCPTDQACRYIAGHRQCSPPTP